MCFVCVCNVFTDRQKQAGVKRAKVVGATSRAVETDERAIERNRKSRLIEWGSRSSTWVCSTLMRQADGQVATQMGG